MKQSRRWLVAGCLALILVAGYKIKVKAQMQTGGPNYVQQLFAAVSNIPQIVLNSISPTYYGQVFSQPNASGVASWNLGYGQTLTGLGTVNNGANNSAASLLSWDVNGWLALKSSYVNAGAGSPSLPAASSCGTNSSGTEGSDQTGDVTVGSSPTNACTITFANKPANKPLCVCNDTTAGKSCGVASVTTNGFTMIGNGGDTFSANDELDWFCSARQ